MKVKKYKKSQTNRNTSQTNRNKNQTNTNSSQSDTNALENHVESKCIIPIPFPNSYYTTSLHLRIHDKPFCNPEMLCLMKFPDNLVEELKLHDMTLIHVNPSSLQS